MSVIILPQDFYVYLHRRSTDGKVFYVGKGKKNRCFDLSGRNQYWHRVVKKHGFYVEIAQDNMQEWWAFEMECQLIVFYGRNNLTNATDGGDGSSGVICSKETKKKQSLLSKNKWLNPEFRLHCISKMKEKACMPDVKKLRSIQRFGKKKSTAMIEKLKKSKKGVKFSESHVNALKISHQKFAHPVLCICLQMQFNSIMDAVRWIQKTKNPKAQDLPIRNVCKGKGKIAYGFKWKYINNTNT